MLSLEGHTNVTYVKRLYYLKTLLSLNNCCQCFCGNFRELVVYIYYIEYISTSEFLKTENLENTLRESNQTDGSK